jgi:hypothetical protein
LVRRSSFSRYIVFNMHLNIHYVYIYSHNGLRFENGVFPAVKKTALSAI